MPAKRTVIFGFLGTKLDEGHAADRWDRWRPTVALCQHEDLLVHRLELLHGSKPSDVSLSSLIERDIAHVSPETTVHRSVVDLENPWDFQQVYGVLHAFARAYPFAPEKEDYLVHITTGTHVAQICLFLLTESRHFPARLIQTSPPKRRADIGPGQFAIIDLDLSRYDQIASRYQEEHREGVSLLKSGIETRNAEFNRQIEEIEKVAIASKAPILLMGPTGAGKSQLARRIWELKKQRHQLDGPFVEVNSATLRGDTAASSLFGHKRGAFTGAVVDRPGLLRSADRGLLFLDEIGELGADEQAMLLRALEEKRFLPVGSDREVESDFQLIAGTNRDLGVSVADGRFREDLLARINLWTFRLPGLRDRIEDLRPNLDFELDKFSRATGKRVSFNKEARERYVDFATSASADWRGNFRDLNASITRLATLATGGRITVVLVDEEIERLRSSWRRRDAAIDGSLTELLGAARVAEVDRFDRVQLADVVQVCRESRSLSEAGRVLFAISRAKKSTANDADRLRKYLARFDLTWDAIHSS
ncbi:MAG: sigma 54-interacting transcriptional regulator [Planctomycetes bacterium]|nr:sigma 54-interacting transcriptional regulator [Planctomycetota bacterium]